MLPNFFKNPFVTGWTVQRDKKVQGLKGFFDKPLREDLFAVD
jgi:hypothetical protein